MKYLFPKNERLLGFLKTVEYLQVSWKVANYYKKRKTNSRTEKQNYFWKTGYDVFWLSNKMQKKWMRTLWPLMPCIAFPDATNHLASPEN